MNLYISILRGINVSGQKLIKMIALKEMYENIGFDNVQTYIQSGNVIFSSHISDNKELEKIIAKNIETVFSYDVPVLVLTINDLKLIIENNPFAKDINKEEEFLHITFLSNAPNDYNQESILEKKHASEEIAFSKDAVYLYCPNGYGKTKLNNTFLETKLKVQATTRNWKTTKELLRLASSV